MECIKVLFELKHLSTQMDIDFLKHFFKTFDPDKSVSLNVTLQNIHIKKIDAADFRSAYYQFCDWFYGWSVSNNNNEFLAEINTSLHDDDFQMKRVPRCIDIKKESELQECERMMQNYITLLRISYRSLKRSYIKIDEKMPLIGTGLNASELFSPESTEDIIDKDVDEIWANHIDVIQKMEGEKDKNADMGVEQYLKTFTSKGITVKGAPNKENKDGNLRNNSMSLKAKLSKVKSKIDTKNPYATRNNSMTISANASSVKGDKGMLSKKNSYYKSGKGPKDIRILKKKNVLGSNMTLLKSTEDFAEEGKLVEDPFEGSDKDLTNLMKADVLPKKMKEFEPETEEIKNELTKKDLKQIKEQEHNKENTPKSEEAVETKEQNSSEKLEHNKSKNNVKTDNNSNNSISNSLSKLNDFDKEANRNQSKNLQLNMSPKVNTSVKKINDDENKKRTTEEDVDYMLIEIDHSMDYTLMCITNLLVVLSFASMLEKPDILHKYIIQANEIAKDFIANTLKNLWDILHLEIPMQRLSLVGLRDMTKLSEYLKEIIHHHNNNSDVEKVRAQSTFKVQKIHHKFQLFHYICTCLDIHILPVFMDAHPGGVKSMEYSSFDKNLWLTAGYDGTIKIYDMKKRKLLSQYAGHRSIVTAAHFIREDSYIISCSFDQSIKIWNAKNAKCEKTLLGHTDSIITCAVTPNSRYILTGGVDCSVRVWEFGTGNNIVTINKHTRWVKVIKVSLDGKYMITGGLDKKIYVWDIKFLVNTKNLTPTHHRCIDYHTDYILDIDVGPNDTMISSSSDMTVKVQNYVTGALIHNISLTPVWATTIKLTADGSMFGLGCSDNSLLIYSTATGKFERQIRLFNFGITSIAFDRELEYALIGTSEGVIQKIPL